MNVDSINKQALAQTYYIIEHMSKKDKKKIPSILKKNIYEKMDKNYVFEEEYLLETKQLLYAILNKYVLDDEIKGKLSEYFTFFDEKTKNVK